jgi:hypothetical protein
LKASKVAVISTGLDQEHVHRAVLAGDEHGVVVGDLRGVHVLQAEREGVFLLRSGHIDDAVRLAPRLAVIGAAAEQDADVRPVSAAFACLAPGEHGAFGRHDDAGDVVDVVGGIIRDRKQVLLFQKGLRGQHHGAEEEEENEFHDDETCAEDTGVKASA